MTTAEEVHVLAFFEEPESAREFGDKLYTELPDIEKQTGLF